MMLAEAILPNISRRMQVFAAHFSRLVAKRTGELQRSIIVQVNASGHFIHIRIRFKIYALILYHMSKSGRRQKRKKGGYVRGSRRYIGANTLSANSPLRTNPQKYQVPIEALFDLKDTIQEIAEKAMQKYVQQQLVNALS